MGIEFPTGLGERLETELCERLLSLGISNMTHVVPSDGFVSCQVVFLRATCFTSLVALHVFTTSILFVVYLRTIFLQEYTVLTVFPSAITGDNFNGKGRFY